ncbi:MAG: shikimate kinase [Clostridium sp.]|nr:shikimate kinase [Clostridium sp.]MCM1399415.1 shikimate kinase [Clostridium sp.]MCM1459969.1 shikimate kinase [Bacteroides sp.]
MGNIVLVGMPGAGKSTIGVLLAKALNYGFIDTDLIIQNKEGKLLFEIIEEKGIEGFLKAENDVIKNVEADKTVIATGGSAVFGTEAMERLKENGTIVYLKLSCEEVLWRVNNITTRGIAMQKGKSLADVYAERTPLYNQYADLTVECNGTTIEECVEKIVNLLRV